MGPVCDVGRIATGAEKDEVIVKVVVDWVGADAGDLSKGTELVVTATERSLELCVAKYVAPVEVGGSAVFDVASAMIVIVPLAIDSVSSSGWFNWASGSLSLYDFNCIYVESACLEPIDVDVA